MERLPFSRAFALALMALALVGCHLGQPASASFASVTVMGKSNPQIREAAAAVFRADGYEAYHYGEGLIFEREGTRANTIGREGVMAAQGGARTMVRVKMDLVDLGGSLRRVQAQAYMVGEADDSFQEVEHRLSNFRSGPYQKLLDEIAARLK